MQPWLLCAEGIQFSPLQRLLHHLHSNGTSKLGLGVEQTFAVAAKSALFLLSFGRIPQTRCFGKHEGSVAPFISEIWTGLPVLCAGIELSL